MLMEMVLESEWPEKNVFILQEVERASESLGVGPENFCISFYDNF